MRDGNEEPKGTTTHPGLGVPSQCLCLCPFTLCQLAFPTVASLRQELAASVLTL
jgi:hypothetical protein